MEELSALAAQGKPVYGPSDLPEHIQGVAHRNSVFSQLVGISRSKRGSCIRPTADFPVSLEIRYPAMVQLGQVGRGRAVVAKENCN